MKLNPVEGKKPFFEVPPRKTNKEQRHLLRDAPGHMIKSNVFYGGGVTKQPNGGRNITQENECDSWDSIQQINARREIFGLYPPAAAANERSVGVDSKGSPKTIKMVTWKDGGLVREERENITTAEDKVSELLQAMNIDANNHKATARSVNDGAAARRGPNKVNDRPRDRPAAGMREAIVGGYDGDDEMAGEWMGRGRERGEMSVDDLREVLNETRK